MESIEQRVKNLAAEVGFELCGVAPAEPMLESLFFPEWIARGYHGRMGYLEGRRGEMRADPRTPLPTHAEFAFAEHTV